MWNVNKCVNDLSYLNPGRKLVVLTSRGSCEDGDGGLLITIMENRMKHVANKTLFLQKPPVGVYAGTMGFLPINTVTSVIQK